MFNFNKTLDIGQCFMEWILGGNITFNCKQLMHFKIIISNISGLLVGL
jgi:hypothetical protein